MSIDQSITSTSVEYRLVNDDPGYRVGDDGSTWTCLIRASRGKGITGSAAVPGPSWRRLKPVADHNGRLYIPVRQKRFYVHRLVIEAFVGPCPPGMECCHDDDNPTNNHVGNLRWDTHKANCGDRAKNGRASIGERHRWAKLTDADVREIRAAYACGGINPKALGDRYGVHPYTIRRIILGRSRSQVI